MDNELINEMNRILNENNIKIQVNNITTSGNGFIFHFTTINKNGFCYYDEFAPNAIRFIESYLKENFTMKDFKKLSKLLR